MSFRNTDAPIRKDQLAASTEPIETVEHNAVEEAMRVIQKHIDKEARNRWVEHLDVRDLCPRQKADLVADLARLF